MKKLKYQQQFLFHAILLPFALNLTGCAKRETGTPSNNNFQIRGRQEILVCPLQTDGILRTKILKNELQKIAVNYQTTFDKILLSNESCRVRPGEDIDFELPNCKNEKPKNCPSGLLKIPLN